MMNQVGFLLSIIFSSLAASDSSPTKQFVPKIHTIGCSCTSQALIDIGWVGRTNIAGPYILQVTYEDNEPFELKLLQEVNIHSYDTKFQAFTPSEDWRRHKYVPVIISIRGGGRTICSLKDVILNDIPNYHDVHEGNEEIREVLLHDGGDVKASGNAIRRKDLKRRASK